MSVEAIEKGSLPLSAKIDGPGLTEARDVNQNVENAKKVKQIDAIEQLRSRQLQLCRESRDLYDAADVDFIAENDNLIRLVLESKSDPGRAAELLDEIMRWRKTFSASSLSATEFPLEIWETGGAAVVGVDRDGDPVFWMRIKYNIPLDGFEVMARRMMVFLHETMLKQGKIEIPNSRENDASLPQQTKKGSGRFTIVNDFEGAGWRNFDLAKARFIAQVVCRYYPGQVKIGLLLNLPWVLKPILSIMGPLVPGDLKFRPVSLKQLFEYIDKDQVPKYAGGNNRHDFTRPPTDGCVSWRQRLPPYINEADMPRFLEATEGLRKEARELALNCKN